VSATVEIGAGPYDLTVVGPNRFLRRFTGNTNATKTEVTATYRAPGLVLELTNHGAAAVTFTITPNNYAGHPKTHRVPAHSHASHEVDLFHGWYDVTVTISGEQSWRYVGHLENGRNSITG
jgi:phospholipase C